MKDVFYFSAQIINVKDLSFVLRNSEYDLLLSETNRALQISLPDRTKIQVLQMDIEKDFEEDEDIYIVNETGVLSSFCVSIHNYQLQDLKAILSKFLQAFGGWIGNDTDGFEPRFSLTEMPCFKCL